MRILDRSSTVVYHAASWLVGVLTLSTYGASPLQAAAHSPYPVGVWDSEVPAQSMPKGRAMALGSSQRANPAQVGAVMAILATWEEAGVLPPESTSDASRIVKALIQFQGALMKSTHPQVKQFFTDAMERKFGTDALDQLQEGRSIGWSSRRLEAVVELAADPRRPELPELESGWQEFNVGSQDLRLLARLHAAAVQQLQQEGKDLHRLFEEKRRRMPGAGSTGRD